MEILTAERWSEERYRLGEGPYYDPRFDRYSWVDILDGKVFTDTQGVRNCFPLGQLVGAAVPLKRSDEFVLAGQDGLYVLEGNQAVLLRPLGDIYAPWQRSNDAKADHAGRLWFGSMTLDDTGHEPGGNLFCLDRQTVRCMQPNTRLSNGMAWSADGRRFFFSDSLYHAVFVYDCLPDGGITNRRVLFEVNGIPDGMCIDAEDNLWLAVWGGSRVEKRSGATGELLAEIRVPAEHVSCCCVGGSDLQTLLITTSGEGCTGELDGCLFACRPGPVGCPPDYAVIDAE